MLSACTNGTTTITTPDGSTTLTVLTYGVPEGETLPVATYDSATDSWRVTDGTNTITLERAEKVDLGGFRAYVNEESGLWTAESPSGDLIAGFAAVDPTASNGFHSVGGDLVRLSDGTIPTGGTASYTGSYGGIIQEQGDPRSVELGVEGDAVLTADFDAATVSGEITNRVTFGDGGTTELADLTLSSTSIGANGTFSGSATGGEMSASPTPTTDVPPDGTTSGATYDGLFGGDNGAEVAVGIHVDHAFNGTDYYETGAFIATQ